MSATLAQIWRHPIKSHGRERVGEVELKAGESMPFDRRWAVAHEDSAFDGDWERCSNFAITTHRPRLCPFNVVLDEAGPDVTVTHPKLGELRFNPDDAADAARFVEWTMPLAPEGLPKPARLVALPGRGFTDSAFASVTLFSMASHRAVEEALGQEITPLRWRGNLWVEGLEAWEEFEWIGREFKVGEAVLRGVERTQRCPMTMTNPETGERDVPTVKTLASRFGHKDFSIRCEVLKGGRIAEGAEVQA
ncbi:MOSC domain-containing protein [Oceanicola sp. D3]|uniref:MOSC domain-containing protein n=1 Tax=Oceanicola sp. D3 TaxID=2587163 RepID=UPI00111CA2BC|nr:MOSC N-terminal beta barrel domain-containing protein [Oceanicola sp. D3]QDC08213.1 MOSC domain-containing protein [Oceanicola sp. D3]